MGIIGNTNKITTYPGGLHNHTDYSNLRLRDAIIKTEELIWHAAELGHEVVGITEHESLSNHVKAEKIYKKVKEKYPNFKLIRGNEIYLCRNGLNANNFNKEVDRYWHFCLYAKNIIGHKQIREISTRAWGRSYMARGMRRVPTYYQDLIDIIGTNPGHVIGSTACLGGVLPTQILKAKDNPELWPKIDNWIIQMVNLFGQGNFFLELQPSNNKDQIFINKKLIELSNKLNVPYIITTDSHYLTKKDRPIHKAYLNAQNGEREVDDFYATTYLMDTEELESFFDYLTKEELSYAYENILKIKDMCEDYSLIKPLKIPQLYWKDYPEDWDAYNKYVKDIPYLETFINSDYIGDRKLVWAILYGIKTRIGLNTKEAYDEINICLDDTWRSSITNKTHWSAYFLNLQKNIDLCWEAGSLVGPGRGSGAGFILLYVLGITQINPLLEETKCYHWRFLNPDRTSILDIDTDIEGTKRGNVLKKFR